ncbi:citrate synthase/methylcitrate synthase [Acidisoma cellulosilytica]|uniref:citrate synthase (unknown stereospecificity) n=1 Tax=Acidisoma cellulosilyticum TaxID=2802395 RepID=A0A964E1N2_9PROT|nr:citrate synthase/methylcitrate synthase [Acidisoma cellulosilyticum]MCB8878700.1 citrate synthase/methylcitrate synthase [Acidisoma cellulosilyticum]
MISGLDDVIAAETALSDVDGIAGRLVIRGQPLGQIAGRLSYEDVVSLLLSDLVPDLSQGAALGAARMDVFTRIAPVMDQLARLDLYDGMRAGIAFMPDGVKVDDLLRLIAAPAVLTPLMIRLQAGQAPVAPDVALGHAADCLAMLGREDEGGALARALDTYLVAVCDHGLNASTFAARVVASTRAGLTSSILAGLGALKGPLHGGAPGPVIAMLDAIAADGDARAWLKREVAQGGRLMGFGHRIYRTRDPRADALKAAVRQLGCSAKSAERLAFAEQVEQTALAVLRAEKPGRVLETNVEFYTALLLEAVGFPPDAFTCVFAMGRVSGWVAHALEQQATGRLIRPQSRYVGPVYAQAR